MAENKNQDTKKQKETEATKNAAVTAAKAYGGPIGMGVNLASKTKLGNAVLNKAAERMNKQNPGLGKLTSALNRGNSDLLNKKKSTNEDANKVANAGGQSGGGLPKEGLDSGTKSKKKSPLSNLGRSNSNSEESESGDFSSTFFAFVKDNWKPVTIGFGAFIIFIVLIVAVYVTVGSIAGGVIEFFQNVGDAIIGFFDENEQEVIQEYYDELDKVREERLTQKGVCIDLNLITATLTVDLDASDYVDQSQEELDDEVEYLSDDTEDPDYYSDDNTVVKQYNRMKKEVGLLANMQIKTVKYGYDKDLNGSCKPLGEETTTEIVTEENQDRFDPKGLNWWNAINIAGDFVSDSPELVAMHDKALFSAFFSKKVNEETNYEFWIHSPAFQLECEDYDDSGNCVNEVQVCPGLPEDEYKLDIGDLSTMEQSVYYWNLVNSFIPNYYEEYLPVAEGEERDAAIKDIAERIYLLYNDIGSSTCDVSGPGSYYAYSDACPDGIMVENPSTKEITIVNLEDYVAGVIAAENNWHQGDNIESMKAQAIAVRSYALAQTNNCQTTIENSSRKQNYKPTTDPYAIKAAMETAGMVLHKDGKILSAEYDAFCVANYVGSAQQYILKQKGQAIPKSFVDTDGTFCKGTKSPQTCGCNGHGRGMSQIGARYLQSIGKSYAEILSYYYGDGTDLATDGTPNNSGLSIVSTGGAIGDWANWKQSDPRWGNTKLAGCTLSNVGCYVTSLAILVAKSGAQTTLGSNFNPGTFAQRLSFDEYCNYSGGLSSVAPSFKSYGPGYGTTASDIANYIKQGYYMQIYITKSNGRPHFVAVDRVVGDTIYIHDPGSGCTTLNGCYPGSHINEIRLFKVG